MKTYYILKLLVVLIFLHSGVYAQTVLPIKDCSFYFNQQGTPLSSPERLAIEAQTLLSKHPKTKGSTLKFEGVDGKDVYNITAPFKTKFNGKDVEVIAGRVESRNSEHSTVMFFTKSTNDKKQVYTPLKDAPTFKLQDPFFSKIGDELTFGGVELVEKDGKIVSYYTSFYKGKSLDDLKHFADGPQGMKDIRLVNLPTGKVGVFTRPQGDIGGRGKIGYTEIKNLDQLTPEKIKSAPLLENLATQFGEAAWGGVNAAYPLDNGNIGILGHVAYWSNEGTEAALRHYHSAVFVFNPTTKTASDMKIIGIRDLLPEGASKRPDLKDVLFSGGLKEEKGTYTLYGGAGDAEGFQLPVGNPFEGMVTE